MNTELRQPHLRVTPIDGKWQFTIYDAFDRELAHSETPFGTAGEAAFAGGLALQHLVTGAPSND